jgi:hypothetical protein
MPVIFGDLPPVKDAPQPDARGFAPTPHLRFMRRWVLGLVLQQLWHNCNTGAFEWRNVPTVEE